MRITELPAYKRLIEMFNQKDYSQGIKDYLPIYCWDDVQSIPYDVTPGHYVYAIGHGRIKFNDIPARYRTRSFFLHALSSVHKDIVEYVKSHPSVFNKQFFKDHIATNYYGLEFELNDFEIMPLEFIDEEMVACAMLRSINMRYVERRGDCEDWFYSVYKRKPEVLTQDLYILGARCFATRRNGKNRFLSITPEEYRTAEYYYALCLANDTRVMEDIPKSVLTTDFLVSLLNEGTDNIQCFSDWALERQTSMEGKGTVKFWQAAILCDGYQIKNIPLNDERIEFFLSLYDKDSWEYKYGFKDHYKRYLRDKESAPEPKNDATTRAAMTHLIGAMLGMSSDSACDLGTAVMNASVDRSAMLPISNYDRVPAEYAKKYDEEEYLLEIYKKIGIQVLREADSYYYSVILPEDVSIVEDEYGYCIKDCNGGLLIHYYDRGPFYDRTVKVDKINVTL